MERLVGLFMIVVVAVLRGTLKMTITPTKKVKMVNSAFAGSPQTFFYEGTIYLLHMQPGNCHGDYLILVDREWMYLHSCSMLLLNPIFSPVESWNIDMPTNLACRQRKGYSFIKLM